jgi:hypothetical protein
VQKWGARDGARTGAEVLALDESDSESAGSSVKRDARAGRAAADDEQVKLFIGAGRAQGVEHVLARRRRPWGWWPASLERGCGIYWPATQVPAHASPTSDHAKSAGGRRRKADQ